MTPRRCSCSRTIGRALKLAYFGAMVADPG
jgi:hypothetical protein